MSPEQQRISIAEACGLNVCVCHGCGEIGAIPYFNDATTGEHASLIPDYLNDMNAMCEAKRKLPEALRGRFCHHRATVLGKRLNVDMIYIGYVQEVFDVTAADEAEAFLRTIGKWEES